MYTKNIEGRRHSRGAALRQPLKLASAFSIAIFLLAGCGGGGGDGGGGGGSAGTTASGPDSASDIGTTADQIVEGPAEGNPCQTASAAPVEPPSDHMVVMLQPRSTTTPGQAMAQVSDQARVQAVIQRVMSASGNASGPAAHAFAAVSAPAVKLERMMSGGAAVVALGQRLSAADAKALANAFAADPDVKYAEPDSRMSIREVATDPGFSHQWYLTDPNAGAEVPQAWDLTTGSSSEVVAVLDTGYRPHHDLTANLVPGYNFISNAATSNNGGARGPDATDPGDWVTQQELNDPTSPYYQCASGPSNSSWHGTLVAGLIGASANNGHGIAGVSWLGKVQPIRVLGKCGGSMTDIADAMRWAAGMPIDGVPPNPTPAKIINLSLGSSGPCSVTMQQAIDDVTARGVSVIAAAGNSGDTTSLDQPANCRGVVAVAATAKDGSRASFSNFGTDVTLSAPGVGIMSTWNDGQQGPGQDGYASADGTSFATPLVAGVAALMLARNPALTPPQVLEKLRDSAHASTVTDPTEQCTQAKPPGTGILNAYGAVVAATQ
ncbi:S8 family peptidase [Burkholderia guangdongensis]|uniref:S8 family peptidase n=1 Tax=Burkholderia guangdongensis TaxID=1792500 RepID=UPI0015C94930|nr:S8 family peptidase [Burkholderia guangdongensis]